MGNIDLTVNKELMAKHIVLTTNFIND